MALTPDDVVNKRFQSTKFREGYDQDEVDDFLDEVVAEFRRLTQENEVLKAQLAGGVFAAPVVVDEPVVEVIEEVAPEIVDVPEALEETVEVVAPVPAVTLPTTGLPDGDVTDESNTLIQLARTLHNQHVAEGVARRDQLIADAEATAQQMRESADEREKEAVGRLEGIIADLTSKKEGVEETIAKLKAFEADYRDSLSTFITGQLDELGQLNSNDIVVDKD